MNEWKKNRIVSQTITIKCAICGEQTKVNNRFEETPFKLQNEKLYFDCPNCKYVYDVPVNDEEQKDK